LDAVDEGFTLTYSKTKGSRKKLAVGSEVSNLGQIGELVVELRDVAVSK